MSALLDGKRVLVVEDEFFAGLELAVYSTPRAMSAHEGKGDPKAALFARV